LVQIKSLTLINNKNLRLEKTEINRDSDIQKFEIAVDLAWKTLKLIYKNIEE